MKSLRDAESAAKNFADKIGGQEQQYARVIGDALGSLEDRLMAFEVILRAPTRHPGIGADDILKILTHSPGAAAPMRSAPTRVETEIRRILG